MTDAELQAWLAQHGGEVGRKDIEDEIDDPSGAVDARGNPRKTKKVDRTEITAKDGATMTLRRLGGSLVSAPGEPQYDVVENTPPKATAAAANPDSPQNQNEAELQRQRKANAALPADQDPAYETDAERRKRAQDRITQQGADAKAAEATKRQQEQDARQARIDEQNAATNAANAQRNASAEQRAVDAANKPSVEIRDDGKGGVVAVSTYPGGRVETKPVPGVVGKPQTLTVEGVVYERGPDGTYKPAAGIPTPGSGLKNVDPFTPDYSQPDLGLTAWSDAQRRKIGLPPEQGGITQKDWSDAGTAAHAQATTAIANITGANTVVRQREQDARSERDTLSTNAANDYTRASGQLDQLLKYTTPSADEVGSLIPAIMAEQAKYRQAAEGRARPAVPLHPMFTGMAQGAGVTLNPTAPAAGFTPTGAQPPAQAPAQAPAALPAPLLGPPPAMPAGPSPTAGEPGGPPLAPGPVMENPYNAAPPMPGQGQDLSTPPAPIDDSDMVTIRSASGGQLQVPRGMVGEGPGQYGSAPERGGYRIVDPGAPIGQGMPPDGPTSAWAAPLTAPQPAPPAQPSLMAGLQQQAAAPQFDPISAGGRLASLGLGVDAIAQALAELGMTG